METGLGASNDRLGFKRLRCRYGTSSCKSTKGCVLLHPGEAGILGVFALSQVLKM